MLNIAICDDSREDRKRLRKFLEETGFLVSIQEFESGEALLRLEESFPVIFLDIDMTSGSTLFPSTLSLTL